MSSLDLWAFSSEDYYTPALEEASKKNYGKAIDLLKEQIADDSSFVEAFIRIADFYNYSSSLKKGVDYFQIPIKQGRGNVNDYLGLAQLYKHAKDWKNTFKNCKTALAKGSTSPYLVDLFVKSALKLKKTNELAKVLRAIKKDSAQKHLYNLGYAIWRLQIKKLKKARGTVLSYLEKRKDFYG
ncbi:hypothetical protein IH970_12790, partial [candidate division KSB1 bacterium]|nr:hypothetical protein [candidate division KSB1 bacterium]